MKTSRHFAPAEFGRCTPPCSIDQMQQSTLDMIDQLRDEAGVPLLLSCAYRSREWDKQRGRSGNSAHTTGHGVDIRCNNSATRMKIVRAAMKIGIRRIGVAGSFVHVDNSPSLAQDVIWTY